jgi:hypothetical protein
MNPHTLTPAQESRLLRGLIVQPFLAAALGFALFPLVDYTGRLVYGAGRTVDPIETAVSFGVMAGVAASFVTGLGAYPTLRWLLTRGPLTRAHALIGGAVLGNVPGVLIVLLLAARHLSRGVAPTMDNTMYGAAGAVRIVLLGTCVGLVCALFFWQLAGRHLSSDHR